MKNQIIRRLIERYLARKTIKPKTIKQALHCLEATVKRQKIAETRHFLTKRRKKREKKWKQGKRQRRESQRKEDEKNNNKTINTNIQIYQNVTPEDIITEYMAKDINEQSHNKIIPQSFWSQWADIMTGSLNSTNYETEMTTEYDNQTQLIDEYYTLHLMD